MIYLLGVFVLIPLYILVAFILSYIPYNRSFINEVEYPILVQLHSNGVHTDILLPIETDRHDWHSFLPNIPISHTMISFGWGDKGFYLNTPTWSDLQLSTAFKACTGLSTPAMHVSYYKKELINSDDTISLFINALQYKLLCDYIKASFQQHNDGTLLLVPHDLRYYDGQFYDAKGKYSIFTSCNSWVNKGFKKTGLKTCCWTPFDWPLLNPYKDNH